MTELLALGASHKTAPLALRERIALTEGGAEPLRYAAQAKLRDGEDLFEHGCLSLSVPPAHRRS